MYSDEDIANDNDASYLRSGFPPYLLLDEEHETDSLRLLRREQFLALHKGESNAESIRYLKSSVAVHRVERFFGIVEGFYTGSLDLTGRHPERFSECHAIWSSYVGDFLLLAVTAQEYIFEDDWLGEPINLTGYKFNPSNSWEEFSKTWKAPFTVGFGFYLSRTRQFLAFSPFESPLILALGTVEKVLRAIAQSSVPKFQKLLLTDLPIEIVDKIFYHAPMENARQLATSCRLLCDIGQRYTFSHRTLSLGLAFRDHERFKDVDDPYNSAKEFAEVVRSKLLSRMMFLSDRPDLLNKLRRLSVLDGWKSQRDILPNGFALADDFYLPIYRDLQGIFGACHNLSYLKLAGLILGPNFVNAIAAFPQLYTLEIFLCRLAVDGILDFPSPSDPPSTTQGSSAYNLQLSFLEGDSSLWHFLLLFPNIRTLCAHQFSGLLQSEVDIWRSTAQSLSGTLERLSVAGLTLEDVPDFVEWLTLMQHRGKLTHFKFCSQDGISDIEAISIVRALQSTPLRVFVIEGLAEGETVLFDEIAQHLPGLHGLTLIRCSSHRQCQNRSCSWPHPSWEYARRMEGLTQLRYFSWNVEEWDILPSPAVLLQFENGFPDDSTPWEKMEEIIETEYFQDLRRWTAILFAVHCQSLQTYANMDIGMRWSISRTLNGRVSSQLVKVPFWSEWNTDRWDPAWPLILPPRVAILA